MNFLGIEISREAESRAGLDDTDDRWYTSILAALPRTASGAVVTPDTAVRLTAVLCAVRIISETIASLPLNLYRRSAVGRDREENHFLSTFLNKPNRWMTRFEFIEYLTTHLLLRGNAYAQVVPTKTGEISQLIPLHSDDIKVEQGPSGKLKYIYDQHDGKKRVFQHWQIMHLKAFSLNGITGRSPIELCREAIGLAQSAEDYGARFYSNDASPGGILEHPSRLDEKVHKRIKESWKAQHSGTPNAHEVAILEEGMTWKPISISPEDAQFLEARQFQVEEIARIFNLPPHMLKDLRHATFSNIEHQDLSYLKHSLRPWLVRWEQVLQRDVVDYVSDEQLAGTLLPALYYEFQVDGLLRGDVKTRNQSHAISILNGWRSINEVRALENLNPIDGGDIHLAPLNMIPVDMLPDFPFGGSALGQPVDDEDDEKEEPDKDDEDEEDEEDRYAQRSYQVFQRVFAQAIERLVRREAKELKRIAKQGRDLEEWGDGFYQKHAGLMEEALGETTLALVEQLSLIKPRLRAYQAKDIIERTLSPFIQDYVNRARVTIHKKGGEAADGWKFRSMFEAEQLVGFIIQLGENDAG